MVLENRLWKGKCFWLTHLYAQDLSLPLKKKNPSLSLYLFNINGFLVLGLFQGPNVLLQDSPHNFIHPTLQTITTTTTRTTKGIAIDLNLMTEEFKSSSSENDNYSTTTQTNNNEGFLEKSVEVLEKIDNSNNINEVNNHVETTSFPCESVVLW